MRKTFKYSETIHINYEQSGSGFRTIVLLHGFGASVETWRDVVPLLESSFTVFAIDLKGSGFSSKPDDDRYSPMDQAKIIASFLDNINARNVILCGNSFGGGVSLMTYFMIAEPERHNRIGALILIDAAAYPQKLPLFMDALTWPLIHSMVPILSPYRRAQMVLQRAFYNDSKITEDRVRRHAQFLSLPGHYKALVATARQIIPDNWDTFIRSIKQVNVPTLILWGEKDEIIPIDHARRFANEIPNSRLQIISGCGHIPQEECPEATAGHIRAFAAFLKQA